VVNLRPVLTVLAVLIALWYAAAVPLNGPRTAEQLARAGSYTAGDWVLGTWSMTRPVLPAPHQIAVELYSGLLLQPVTSRRSLVFHAAVTASATLVGLGLGLVLGVALAIGIVAVPVLDRSLMPWIIASQTVPVLAIAPMIVVVLGNLGVTGVLPKAVISGYLSFFPVVVGMVKGLRSPDPLQLDLMRTYSAAPRAVFAKLRWPAATGFLFPSLKVAITLALTGAVVAELPTGAQAGLGARLLAGSYYGQTVQIWAALVMAAVLAILGIGAIDLMERVVIGRRGGRR